MQYYQLVKDAQDNSYEDELCGDSSKKLPCFMHRQQKLDLSRVKEWKYNAKADISSANY